MVYVVPYVLLYRVVWLVVDYPPGEGGLRDNFRHLQLQCEFRVLH